MPSYKKEKEFKKFLKFVLINKKADIRFKVEISQACYKEGNPRPIDGLQMTSLTTVFAVNANHRKSAQVS